MSKLIQLVEGEEVVIAVGKQPVVKLVALPQRRLGGAADVIKYIADDFDEPLDVFAEYMP